MSLLAGWLHAVSKTGTCSQGISYFLGTDRRPLPIPEFDTVTAAIFRFSDRRDEEIPLRR